MTWTRLSDDFIDRPELLAISRSARLLHVEALVWCNRLLKDGRLPSNIVRRITDSDELDDDIAQLVDAGLWTTCEHGWEIEWKDQELAKKVTSRRKQRDQRQERFAERKALHGKGDHSLCDPRFCPYLQRAVGNALRDASADTPANALTDASPSRPDPTLPDPDFSQGGQGAGRAELPAGRPARLPVRTTAGRLRKLDAATLDELPWHDIGTSCPHDGDGWCWVDETATRFEGVRCEKCMQLVRNTSDSVSNLARTYSGPLGTDVWLALFELDPDLTSAALCIGSLICERYASKHYVGSQQVDAVAGHIVRSHPSQPLLQLAPIFERKSS